MPISRTAMQYVALLGALTVVIVAVSFGEIQDVFVPQRDDPAIEYTTRPTSDRVSALNREIEAGTVRLKFEGTQGYLRSVLDALNVSVESQIAVFSKTSFQAQRINPQNPRTLFFNDSVAVGWVRGGFVEIAVQDPHQGVIFYTLEQKQADKPQFTRRDGCLGCHDSNDAEGVPGMLVRSSFTAPDGTALRELGNYTSDHRSPLEQRWGGWYVTGMSGSIRHMGNAVVTNSLEPESAVTDQNLNLESLVGRFDTDGYLSPYSDIVALMVFEHQMHMMNLLTRIGWQTRYAMYQGATNNKPAATGSRNPSALTEKNLYDGVQDLVDYMLFVDEAPLTSKIKGTSGFSEKFSTEGPQDALGRSFRQLDLDHRLMKYPCSYMIYSEAFDGLPPEAKDSIYKRMWQILSGEVKNGKYTRLSLADRKAIVEILRETRKGLPDYFRPITH